MLTRIFHTDLLRKPGSKGGCCAQARSLPRAVGNSYSRRQTSSLALPHQPSRLPRLDQYKISVLAHRFLCALLEFTQLK
jgi:hypothetical protein